MAQVKVTLVKSLAGRPGDQRATIVALGLHRTNLQRSKRSHPADQRDASQSRTLSKSRRNLI